MPDSGQSSDVSVKNISIGTAFRLLRYPFIALSALVIPRLMGDVTYGYFALFMAVYMILDQITDIGFTQVFGRFLPEIDRRGHRETAHFLHQIMAAGMVITAGVILLVGAPLYITGKLNFRPLWWSMLCILLLITKIKGTLFAFLYGKNDIARFSLKEFLRSALTFVLVVILHHFYGLPGALAALALNELIVLAVGAFWTYPYVFTRPQPIRWSKLKPYMRFGVAFYVPMLFFVLLQRSGNVLIELLTGQPEEIAYFDVANQYFLLTGTFLGMIFTTLLPSLTRMYLDEDDEKIDRWQKSVMTYCGLVVLLTAHALLLIGRDVIVLCLGPDYRGVFQNAVILTPAIPSMLITFAGMNYTVLRKEPAVFTKSVLGGLIVMLAAGIALIPVMRSAGAATAGLAGYTTLALLLVFRYRRIFGSLLVDFGKALLLGCILIPFHFIPGALAMKTLILVLSSLLFIVAAIKTGFVKASDARKIAASFARKK
jgi:O-antigen/teichoic acid export membrane protein